MSELNIISSLSEIEQKFLKLVLAKKKIAALNRAGNWALTTAFTGDVDIVRKTFTLAYPGQTDKAWLKAQVLSKVNTEDLFMGTVLSRGQVWGLNFKIKETTHDGLVAHFPEHIYEINRRAVKRWNIPSSYNQSVYVEFLMPQLSSTPIIFSLADLSPLGLSFKVPKFLEQFFKANQMVPNAHLRMGGKELAVNLEIRNILNNQDPKFPKKAGVKFVKPNPAHQIEILKFLQTQFKDEAAS